MKTKTITIIYMLGTLSAFAAGDVDADATARMSVSLHRGGVEELMISVREGSWTAPSIPSKWFAENRIEDTGKRRLAQAARDFGRQIGIHLEKLAQEQQTLPTGDTLHRRTLLLCDAGEWCGETEGYGNIFLARRFLDLAAIGLARLTASTNFPLSRCEALAARMTPSWLGMAYRLQVLNYEAGTNLFVNAGMTNQELDWQWSIGWSMRTMTVKKTTGQRIEAPNPAFVNLNAFTNNLDYFTYNENPESPVTLLRSWDYRQHRFIAMGLELQSVDKAIELLRFRTIIGQFPKNFVRSEKDRLQLERDIIEAAKWGAKMTPMENSSSFDPLKEAFRRAWLNRPNRKPSEDNRYTLALQAYREVNGGIFFDRDTAEIANFNQQQEMMKARQNKSE